MITPEKLTKALEKNVPEKVRADMGAAKIDDFAQCAGGVFCGTTKGKSGPSR